MLRLVVTFSAQTQFPELSVCAIQDEPMVVPPEDADAEAEPKS